MDEGFYEDENMLEENVDLDRWILDSSENDSRRFELLKGFITDKKVLDFGGGAGGFVRMIKPYSSHVAISELHSSSVQKLRSEGYHVYHDLEEIEEKFDVITLFHVLEHVKDPLGLIDALLSKLNEDGILVLEVPTSSDALLTMYDCEAYQNFIYWSPHLYLFNSTTIDLLVKKTSGSLVFQKGIQRYNLSNHLYWLSKSKPGGHNKWFFMNEPNLQENYEQLMCQLNVNDTIMFAIKKGN